MIWQACASRLWGRLHIQLLRQGVHVHRAENKHSGVVVFSVMDELLLKYEWEEGKPRRHFYNPSFKWDFNVKSPLDIILPVKKHRNPAKTKRVTRDDLIAGEIFIAASYEDFKTLRKIARHLRQKAKRRKA